MKLTLYHGTSARALPTILKEGIRPRQATGCAGNYDREEIKSHADLVYLTSHYAAFYGLIAVDQLDSDEQIAIVRVEVSSAQLYPDEDFLRIVPMDGVRKAHPSQYKALWKASLDRLGTVATRFVRPDKITGSVLIPQHVPPYPFWLSFLGADANNVSIARTIGVGPFESFKTRTALLFEGGVKAVIADWTREREAMEALMKPLKELERNG